MATGYPWHRRRPGWTLLGILLVLLAQDLGAAENCFPRGKSVTFIIPAAIGSVDDFYARMVKTVAEDAIGSQFNPRNVPAKGGLAGMTDLYGARPSGRTLGVLNAADLIVAGLAGAVPFEITQYSIFGRIVDTPRAVFVGKSAFDKGIQSPKDVVASQERARWGITTPSNFFAAAVLDELFGINGQFVRIRGSAEEAVRAAVRGDVDLVLLEIQSLDRADGKLVPILALGPEVPTGRVFEKYEVPMAGQLATGEDAEKALAVARITASGLIIAGPPHIPGIRVRCVQAGFQKALGGANLRALAGTAGKSIAPLDSKAAADLVQKLAGAAAPFKTIWIEALKELGD